MITNWASFFAFMNGFVCLAIYALFLTPKQVLEVGKPKDFFTGLRWIILTILIVSAITSVPSIVYQGYRMVGQEGETLRSVSTITSNISKTSITLLLVLVFTYKRKT